MSENKNKKFISTQELAKILGISRIAVFKKIKNGQIKAQKIGRNFAIETGNLESVLQGVLTDKNKKEISRSVEKTIKEYGETLRLLGKE
jgi:excisionase family DNA binding protein